MDATLAATQEGRHRFAAALQSALTVKDVEDAFLQSAAAVISSGGFGLYHIDPTSGRMLAVNAQVEVDFLADYESYGRQDDPVLNFVVREKRAIDSSRVASQRDWERCGARSALGVGGYYHSLEAPVIVSGVLYGTMNFARDTNQPRFSEVDLVSARIASEQLGLATERAMRYESTGRRTTMFEHVLDRIPQALVVTDLDAQVIFRNRAARTGSGTRSIMTDTDGFVRESIAEAMSGFRTLNRRVYTRTARDRHSRRQVVVRSIRLPDLDEAAMTMVFDVAEGDECPLPAWDVLSKREQQIAALVSEGLTNKEIAQRAFVSENTVKQHLKRIFAKTDVRNRAELMQRIWVATARSDTPGRAR